MKSSCQKTMQYFRRNCSNILAGCRIFIIAFLLPAMICSILSFPDDAFLDFVDKNPSLDVRAYYLLFIVIATSLIIYIVCTFCFPMGGNQATLLVSTIDWLLVLVSGTCMVVFAFLLKDHVSAYIELLCGPAPYHYHGGEATLTVIDCSRQYSEIEEYVRCYCPTTEAIKYGYFKPAFILCRFAGLFSAVILLMLTYEVFCLKMKKADVVTL